MNIVHLMASPFFGGPERQVLGLARSLPCARAHDLSVVRRARSGEAVSRARRRGRVRDGHAAREHAASVPLRRGNRRTAAPLPGRCAVLQRLQARCHRLARAPARGVPVVAIAHGWTAATWKVRANETLDRLVMHGMDCTVCVSAAQAAKVRRAGVPASRDSRHPQRRRDDAIR